VCCCHIHAAAQHNIKSNQTQNKQNAFFLTGPKITGASDEYINVEDIRVSEEERMDN